VVEELSLSFPFLFFFNYIICWISGIPFLFFSFYSSLQIGFSLDGVPAHVGEWVMDLDLGFPP